MAYQDSLSDYDNKLLNQISDSELLLIDLDGTLIDFEMIDNMIISLIFPESKFIDIIDSILWKINKLDIIGNGYAGLKLRLAIYSLFCSNVTYKQVKSMYSELYKTLAKQELERIYKLVLSDFIAQGYKIMIATKNVYAIDIINDIDYINETDRENIKLVVLRKHKKEKFQQLIEEYNGKICVIGNNLSDDIINSFKIGAPYIYIGESNAIKIILQFLDKISHFMGWNSIYNRGIQLKEFESTKLVLKRSRK